MSELFERETIAAISLWQPWASLWVCMPRMKLDETRHWPAPRRYIGKRILVHAAKTLEGIKDALDDAELSDICAQRFGQWWDRSLPLGGFIGSVVLTSCERITDRTATTPLNMACGNWAPGRYAWRGDDPQAWPMKPAKGRQGFWNVPTDLAA